MDDQVIMRVKEVIAASGLTQRGIANALGIDSTKLSKSLNGVRRFSSFELASIAEIGGCTVDWILTGAERSPLRFANRTIDPSVLVVEDGGRERAMLIAQRHQDARELGFLPGPVGLPPRPVSGGYVTQAETMAAAAVARLGSPLQALSWSGLIRSVEEAFGIHVAVERLSSGIDGMSLIDGELRLAVVSTTDRPGRQRFTLAHELGHILFGDGGREVIEETLFQVKSREESRADAFAASFLMPREEILAVLAGRPPHDVFPDLVWAFRVSPDSMAWRLRNLELVDEEQCRRLRGASQLAVARQLGRLDEHRTRIGDASAVRSPGRLADAYIGAFLIGEVGAGPTADISGLSIDTIRRLLDEVDFPDMWPNQPAGDETRE